MESKYSKTCHIRRPCNIWNLQYPAHLHEQVLRQGCIKHGKGKMTGGRNIHGIRLGYASGFFQCTVASNIHILSHPAFFVTCPHYRHISAGIDFRIVIKCPIYIPHLYRIFIYQYQ